jgi:hypothetical protein
LHEITAQRSRIISNRLCTPMNAVLSKRLADHPERFFLDGLQTFRDLCALAESIRGGNLEITRSVAQEGTLRSDARLHLLGYSLGGYLSLILRLHPRSAPLFASGKTVLFCSGAALRPGAGGAANPTSPLILDSHATERLRAFYLDGNPYPHRDTEEAALFEKVFVGDGTDLPELLATVRDSTTVIVGESDVVIPAASVASHLGAVDVVLPIGLHEYPFNLGEYVGRPSERLMARAYDVGEPFRVVFQDFMDHVLGAITA